MSRRDYGDRYDDRESEVYRRPRRDRDYDELDVDIIRTRDYPESRAPRGETVVKERDTVITDRRTERGPRQPEFLRDDYGKTTSGALVVRREERDEDTYSRAPTRRRSLETVRSRAPTEMVVEKDEIVIRERERDRGPPYPRSERDFMEKEEIIIRDGGRERARSRPPRERSDEEIDIKIKRREESRPPPPRSEAPSRNEYRERDVEEIRFRRGGGEMPPARPPPMRTEVDREEIRFTETRSPPPRSEFRGREVVNEEIDIREERSMPPPGRESRGQLVARDREEWIVRRKREVSPPPPPRDYEKEEIIIRRRERTPSPEPPPREPTPEPAAPPPPEPIIRPPIIQEVITHHRHIDHGIERVRSPASPAPPAPPSSPREENLEIEIKRQGTRNGRAYEEDIIFERDITDTRRDRHDTREVSRRRSLSASTRRQQRSPSPVRTVSRKYEQDDIAQEAEYYNRKVRERGYPGEAYNGATKDWGLVDVPPGTERVRMDGAGGGAQEISWQRYNGERRGRFITGDRVYEDEYGNGAGYESQTRSSPPIAPPAPERDVVRETRITRDRIVEETSRGKTKDKMWTELTRDLVIREAVDEMGYEYEETDEFFYVMEYLRYEDVLRLVELTEDIRRERRERIREIQWERERMEREALERGPKLLTAPPPLPSIPPVPASMIGGRGGRYDEKVYERDYVYERDGRRYR